MQSIASWLITAAAITALTSCGGSSLPGGDEFPSILPDDPTAGFDTTGFFIGVVNNEEINSHVRTSGSFGTSCEIAGTSANTDLSCWIDVPEGDLNFYGVDLVYNVPAGMCRYLRRTTYWYHNEETGYGPTSIVLDYTTNADGSAVTASTCSVDGGPGLPCNSTFNEVEFKIDGGSITPRCSYDKTPIDRPNCCFGTYTLDKTITTDVAAPDPDTVTTSFETLDWDSGKDAFKECVGGAGRTNWDWYSKTGYPVPVIQFAQNGLSDKYELKAPIQTVNNGTNYSIANFYITTPVAIHNHSSFGTATTSTQPYFIVPITDRNGTPMTSGNNSYSFECLDEAFEVKHRIRAYVRDWDTYADYLAYIASAGVTSVPDRPGVENTNCDGILGPCNDELDLDDFVNALPGAVYETVTPTLRGNNFPFHDYD